MKRNVLFNIVFEYLAFQSYFVFNLGSPLLDQLELEDAANIVSGYMLVGLSGRIVKHAISFEYVEEEDEEIKEEDDHDPTGRM